MTRKTAITNARDYLDEVPARSVEALQAYVNRGRLVRSDLQSYIGGARVLGDTDYLEAISLLDAHEDGSHSVNGRIEMAELMLEAVRNELPLESTEVLNGDESDLDVEATINKAAALFAIDTLGMDRLSRVHTAMREYEMKVDPLLPEGFKEFPRDKFAERLGEYLAMTPAELKIAVEREFPTADWIGEAPEGAVEHIPTSGFENEEPPAAVDEDSDGVFEDKIEKERKYRGIPKNEETNTREGAQKTAVEDPDNVDFAGAGEGTDAAPKAKDSLDSEMTKNLSESRQGEPRGPNRRKGDDVPAWSTPKQNLTAALKLAEQYENMSAEDALRIVSSVSEVLAGEIPPQFKEHVKGKDSDDDDDKDDGEKKDSDSDDKPDFLKSKDSDDSDSDEKDKEED